MFKKTVLAISLISLGVYANADITDDAKAMADSGDLDGATQLYETARAEGIHDAYLGLAEIALKRYDFELASKYLKDYSLAIKKAKKEASDRLSDMEETVANAEDFLGRVENIVVLDSLYIPKDDFFNAYRIPSSAGRLSSVADSDGLPDSAVSPLFSNEGGDFRMWAEPDSVGNLTIMESSMLTDGKWSAPVATPLPEHFGNDAYPFMMADGVTLYFASDGPESIGGYDIFIASRDAATGEYLQPKNLGMPYNSPFDDYMMAIDEENGVGWWATDRNRLGSHITVYLYKVNDLRNNYNPDDEDIIDKARIADYRSTWDSDEDYSGLLATIKEIVPGEQTEQPDFIFPLPGGGCYKSIDDFPDSASRNKMIDYRKSLDAYNGDCEELSSLRREYHKAPSETLKGKIRSLETSTDRQRTELKRMKSDIYRLLKR